jgi:hypothetical protein
MLLLFFEADFVIVVENVAMLSAFKFTFNL